MSSNLFKSMNLADCKLVECDLETVTDISQQTTVCMLHKQGKACQQCTTLGW